MAESGVQSAPYRSAIPGRFWTMGNIEITVEGWGAGSGLKCPKCGTSHAKNGDTFRSSESGLVIRDVLKHPLIQGLYYRRI